MDNLKIYFSIAFICFIWLRTNLFSDILSIFGSKSNFLYLKSYKNFGDSLEYPLWLYVTFPSALTKLISCPLCLSFWASFFIFGFCLTTLESAFVSIICFSTLDKLYKHGK